MVLLNRYPLQGSFMTDHNMKIHHKQKGFILPFTMLISAIVLFITTGAMTLLSKQLYFSKLYKQSQVAYYAADDAVTCAIDIDDTYQGSDGKGIFPNSTSTDPSTYMEGVLAYVNVNRQLANLPTIDSLNDITCAQSKLFDPSASDFSVSSTTYEHVTQTYGTEEGKTSSYSMKMDLGDGTYRCAKVTVNKTPTFRQIIAQGYAQCDNPNGTVERAVVNTTVIQ